MNIKSTNPQILIHTGLAVSKSTNAEDAAIQPAKPSSGIQSLQEHDKKYHPNGWKRGDSCKLRDSLFSDANGVDNLTPSGNTTNHVSNSQRMPTKDKYDSAIDGIEAYEDFLPKDVIETIREYPKKSTELAETIEELQGIVNDIPDSNARKIGLEEIKNKEKEWADLQTRFLAAYEAIDGVFNTGTASSSNVFIPQYKPLEHKEKNFPKKIDSVVDDGVGGKIVTINGIQYNFSPAGGSTGATKGVIDIGGKKQMFFLKTDNSTLTADAVRNEFASDEFLRSAGVHAPDGMLYSLGNGHIAKLTTEVPDVIGDLSNGVGSLGLSPTQKNHLVEKLREAYPLLDVMYHTDAFKNDNILVDKDANPWFVDNGSSFLYRARGGLKDSTWGGPDMTKRANASDPKDGYGTLYGHHSQKGLRADIGKNMTNADLLREAAKYDMEQLVQNAIQGTPQIAKDCPGLLSYAKTLDKMADPYRKLGETPNADKPRKVVATGGVKPGFGQASQPQPAQAQATGQNQTATTGQGAGASQQQSQVIPKAQQQIINYLGMPQGVGAALVGTGADLQRWAVTGGGNSPFPEHWFNDVIDSKSNQTAVNMMTQLQSSLPAGYSAGLYDESGINGICIVKTSDKQNLISASTNNWPNGGFQQWIDGGQAGMQQTSASQPVMMTVGSSNNSFQIPTTVAMTMTNNVGASGIGVGPSWATTNGSLYAFATQDYTSSLADAIAQQAANQLSANSGYTVFTFGRGNGKANVGIIQGGPAGIPKQWGATIFTPQQQTSTTASGNQNQQTATTASTSSASGQGGNTSQQQAPASAGSTTTPTGSTNQPTSSQPAMTTVSSFNQGTLHIPTPVAMAMTNNIGGVGLSMGSSTLITNGNLYAYSNQPYASNTADTMAQQAANQLSANSGYTVFTYGAGTGQKRIGIIQGGPSNIPSNWGATIFKPQGQTATPASTTASKPSPAASKSSQQQPASKPASTQPSSSSSSSASATSTSTPKFTYGSAGSLVKSGGFNDGNISTDISNLISSTGLQSVKGKMLLAPGTKLKTQGSIANNGDLYIGLPAGTKKSDLQAIANHLNNEYGQYGYSAYPMGGSWISIEPTKQNTMKAKQTATAPAASTPKQAQTPASTPATSQTPPSATTSTQSTKTATTNPGGTSTSQPASTTATASNQTTGQTSATPTAQTAVPPPPRKTLSQMIQQRLASANPQQQARFKAALNRANGNSGIPPQPQTLQGASQQPQTASQTSGQSTTPSGQQSQQTASTVLLTAPKSGNQPTPAQQKTIARFQQQIQNARTPTQKAAFQQALSRYFGAI